MRTNHLVGVPTVRNIQYPSVEQPLQLQRSCLFWENPWERCTSSPALRQNIFRMEPRAASGTTCRTVCRQKAAGSRSGRAHRSRGKTPVTPVQRCFGLVLVGQTWPASPRREWRPLCHIYIYNTYYCINGSVIGSLDRSHRACSTSPSHSK